MALVGPFVCPWTISGTSHWHNGHIICTLLFYHFAITADKQFPVHRCIPKSARAHYFIVPVLNTALPSSTATTPGIQAVPAIAIVAPVLCQCDANDAARHQAPHRPTVRLQTRADDKTATKYERLGTKHRQQMTPPGNGSLPEQD